MNDQPTPVRVTSLRKTTSSVLVISLSPIDNSPLTPVPSGTHLDLFIPHEGGMFVRQYSLTNAPWESPHYEIAVMLEPQSRGGSLYIHSSLRIDDILHISPPRDRFELIADSAHTVLIAGGIGVAPIWSHVQQLEQKGASYEIHYAARSHTDAAFLPELSALAGDKLTTYFGDQSQRISLVDLARQSFADNTHVYCCGPGRMMDDFDNAFSGWSSHNCHREHFHGFVGPVAGGEYQLVLARSGRVLTVPSGSTILQTLRAAGINTPFSCSEGVCGMCETGVIDGTPDHRDRVLTLEERQKGNTMMICCSGATSPRLVLDL